MKNLSIDALRAFITALELGGFTQAGEYLGRTQPAISMQIKKLEDVLGQSLLIRRGQSVELTKAGQIFRPYARQILALNDEAVEQFSQELLAGKVRLGIPSEFASTLLPKIVGLFSQSHPNVTLAVTSDLSKNLLHERRRLDFDLILGLHPDPSQVASANIVRLDELVWVTSPDHEAHQQAPCPLIVAPEGCIYRARAVERLTESGIAWRLVYTNPDLSGIRSAIEEGLGVTVLAKSTVPSNLKILKGNDRYPKLGKMAISLVKPQPSSSPTVDRLAEYLAASLN
ncbi:LysR family transcriptional regulator [Aestuariicella hydrocarbonica]|uniref:LysR family transcriptional regulator n=1 Tax=Pseudomaricurvus hydrocarbonicus TaxID=1470433 RepID=A0A9E5JZ08_9GAMM|nr:LysR family transcriptional regulator [Aestuariicella hydrocarbonica]NHO64967.1 LysR family transcriptional regulator [Aestuariicella hydrocarbonica]